MKERFGGILPRTIFCAAVLLGFGLLGATRAHAQTGPCTVSGSTNQHVIAMRAAIYNLQQQGASVTCDNQNMYVTMPDGAYFNIRVPPDAAVSLFAFNPVTGHTIQCWLTDGYYGPNLIISDSNYGLINAGDGWFDLFYPVGNPFSAAVQDPIENMFVAGNANPDPWGINTAPSPRPAMLQDCCSGTYY